MDLHPKSLSMAIFEVTWWCWGACLLLLGFILTIPVDLENYRFMPVVLILVTGMFTITLSIGLTRALYLVRNWVYKLEISYVELRLFKLLQMQEYRWDQMEMVSFIRGQLSLCYKTTGEVVTLNLDLFYSHEINLWGMLLELAQMHQFPCNIDEVTYFPETYG